LAGALVEGDHAVRRCHHVAVGDRHTAEEAETPPARAAAVDGRHELAPPVGTPGCKVERGDHPADRGGEDTAVDDRGCPSGSASQLGAPLEARGRDLAATSCGGQIVCGQLPRTC
jgi:hypothetical protein